LTGTPCGGQLAVNQSANADPAHGLAPTLRGREHQRRAYKHSRFDSYPRLFLRPVEVKTRAPIGGSAGRKLVTKTSSNCEPALELSPLGENRRRAYKQAGGSIPSPPATPKW